MSSDPPTEMTMKQVYSTGEAAGVCRVSQQTIIRCFDAGKLHGFRVPGSKFRRIPRQALLKFMKENDIPLDNLDGGRIKVMVVDDDLEIVELFVDVLTRDGRFDVRTAGSGFDAGLVANEFEPDVIILDYMLPDINGNVVCSRLRSEAKFDHVKVIIVSGVVNQREIDELLNSGADEFVKKPFNIDKIVDLMIQLVGA